MNENLRGGVAQPYGISSVKPFRVTLDLFIESFTQLRMPYQAQ
jgi:hypothetical protein